MFLHSTLPADDARWSGLQSHGCHWRLEFPSHPIFSWRTARFTFLYHFQRLISNCPRQLSAVRCANLTYRISPQSPLCSHNLIFKVLCRGLAAVTVDSTLHFESHLFASEARSNMLRLPAAITLSPALLEPQRFGCHMYYLTSRLASHVCDSFCRRIDSSRVWMLSGSQTLDFLVFENLHLEHHFLFSSACRQPSQIRATKINLSPTTRAPGTTLFIVFSVPSQIVQGDFPLSDVLHWHIASHVSHPWVHIT